MTSKVKKKVHHNVVTFGGSYIKFDHHIRVRESEQVSLILHLHLNL